MNSWVNECYLCEFHGARSVSAATHTLTLKKLMYLSFRQFFYTIFLDPFRSSLRLPVPLTFCLVQSISWLSLLSLSLSLSLSAINSSRCRSLRLYLTFVFIRFLLSNWTFPYFKSTRQPLHLLEIIMKELTGLTTQKKWYSLWLAVLVYYWRL